MRCASSIALLIVIVLPLIVLMVFLMVPADIQAATNTTEIQVNVSEVAQITVSPDNIAWSQIPPGGNGTPTTVTVKNIGSTSFSSGIYVSVDSFNGVNPTAGDDVTKYRAGSFLVIKNSTYSDSEYWFVNQMSWNESTYPEPTSPTSGAVSWGYYHNMSNSWLWELKPGDDGTCRNSTNAGLKIVPTAGSKDLSGATSADFVSNTTEWGLWNVTTGPLADYCIATHTDCTKIMIYKHDLNSSLPANCPDEEYIAPGSFSPGIEKFFDVKPHVPYGVPSGTVTNSTVTFTAE